MIRSMMFVLMFVLYLAFDQAQSMLQSVNHLAKMKIKPKETNAIFTEVRPIKLTHREKDCLVRNVYYEAGTEKVLGKIAVAQVTLNRAQLGYWGKHICDVVYAPEQFSWTKDQERINDNPQGQLWKESLLAVNTVVDNGIRIKQLDKALFYHTKSVKPFWKDNNKMIGQIGNHVFYWGGKDSWLEL